MSDHDDKKKRDQEAKEKQDQEDKKKRDHDQDTSELGPVDSLNDLQPETGVGPTRKAKEQDRILLATQSGYFEGQGGSSHQLGAPLHLGGELKKDAGPVIDKYVEAYDTYAVSLRSTLRAMGRAKDVSLTGAPMTPEELMKRPELAARFRRLRPGATSAQQDQASGSWSYQQRKMTVDTKQFGAIQHKVAAAVANYRRVQVALKSRALEAKRTGKVAELEDINEAAATLARIVDVSFEAATGFREVEEHLEQTVALDEHAEGPETGDGLPKNASPNWQYGTADDPTGASHSIKGGQQRGATAAKKIAAGATAAGRVAAVAKQQLAKTGKFDLSLEDAFKALMAGDKYNQLQKDIVRLDEKIATLKLEQEAQDIASAKEQLRGAMLELGATVEEVRTDRAAARSGASTFAKTAGGGNDTITAMYAAEAYQELAAFGALAAQQRKDFVEPLWRPVHSYLHGHDAHRFVVLGAMDDAIALDTNLRAVKEQGVFLGEHVPSWQRLAHSWSNYLASRTGAPLTAEGNETDRDSEAP